MLMRIKLIEHILKREESTPDTWWQFSLLFSFFEEIEKKEKLFLNPTVLLIDVALIYVVGTSKIWRSQNIFPQILVTFKIKNLATHNCDKDWGREASGKVRVGDAKFVR